jgi:hypothetical protein
MRTVSVFSRMAAETSEETRVEVPPPGVFGEPSEAGAEEKWFAPEKSVAQCALHPHALATVTCARCGSFCCDDCSKEAWCEPCGLLVKKEHLPSTARSVAWKLLLGPVFLIGSAALWLHRGKELPAEWVLWMIPVICAGIVLRRFSPAAAWTGAITSLLLLGWQAFSMFAEGAELRLIDVGLLAIAPLLALDGAWRLGRLFHSVKVQVGDLRGQLTSKGTSRLP